MRTRRPRGAALILMHVIWRQPRPVLQAVAQAWRAQLDFYAPPEVDTPEGDDGVT